MGAGASRISVRTRPRSRVGQTQVKPTHEATTPPAPDGKQRSQRTARRSAARQSAGCCPAPRTGRIPPAGTLSLTRSGEATPEGNHSLTRYEQYPGYGYPPPMPGYGYPPAPGGWVRDQPRRCVCSPRPRRPLTESPSLAIPRRPTDTRAILPPLIPAIPRHPMAIPRRPTRATRLRPIQAIPLLLRPLLSRVPPPVSPRPPTVRVQTFDRF